MRTILFRSIGAIAALIFVSGSQAALIDRGEGFIYDNVLDVTWAQNANINGTDTWDNQVAWAAGYSQTHTVYGTFDDWRLPSVDVNGDNTIIDCGSDTELACRDNEYGYLAFIYGLPGPFSNVQSARYWSGTEDAGDSGNAWDFSFLSGATLVGAKGISRYAWAVRDGDVAFSAVPVPAAAWLFGSALGLLGWIRHSRN